MSDNIPRDWRHCSLIMPSTSNASARPWVLWTSRRWRKQPIRSLSSELFTSAKLLRRTSVPSWKLYDSTLFVNNLEIQIFCPCYRGNEYPFYRLVHHIDASTEETDINYYSLLKTFVYVLILLADVSSCIDAMDPYFSRTDFLAVLNEKPELKENFDYMTYGESFSYKPKNLCRPLYLFYKKAVNTNEVKSRLNEVTMKFSNEYFNEAFKECIYWVFYSFCSKERQLWRPPLPIGEHWKHL